MSLDIDLHVPDKCPHCGAVLSCGRGTNIFSRNITHNVTPMWEKAGVYEALYESDGKRAAEFVEALQKGVAHFRANYSEYQKLDSPNGWGLAKNALPWLEEVARAFEENPDAIIGVSR